MYRFPARALGALLAALMLATLSARQVAATEFGGDFVLHRAGGGSYALHESRGKVVIVFFGYTSCPDVCPMTLGLLHIVMKRLGPQARDVQPLFVTVDPGRDTPEVLRSYVAQFDASIIGLTGPLADLRSITARYGTYFRYQGDVASGRYTVDHSASLYVIDRQGHLARIIPAGMPATQILDSVRQVLNASGPARRDGGTPPGS